MSSDDAARARLSLVAFGLVSGSVLAGQIVLSRVFAVTVGYDYAFMLVSLAMLGLGSGGMVVRQLPKVFTPERMNQQCAWLAMGMGVACTIGLNVMLRIYPGVIGGSLWVPVALFWTVFPFFLFAGVLVALVLSHARERFYVAYSVDLGSAAIGCIVAVLAGGAMTAVEVMLFVVAIVPAAAGALFGVAGKSSRVGLAGFGCCIALGLAAMNTLEVPAYARPWHIHYLNRQRVLSEWSAATNITAYTGPFYTWSLSPKYKGPRRKMMDVVIDGAGGTEVVQFDGDPKSLASYDYLDQDMTALGHELVPAQGRQLIIGPGGGVDILQAVRRGRTDITAVEINPLMQRVVNDDLSAFSGRPYALPGVTVRIENGRTFMKRATERWDLLTLTWVDTGGSAQAMAFSEYYLYTVEAYTEFLDHLTPNGMFAFMRALGVTDVDSPIDTMRGISVAATALRKRDVSDPSQNIIVGAVSSPFFYSRPMCYVLVKLTPFSPEEVAKAKTFFAERAFRPLWLPGGLPREGEVEPKDQLERLYVSFSQLVREILTTKDPERLQREAKLDITPTVDDRPFYFMELGGPNRKSGKSLARIHECLGILLSLVVPFIGIPLLPMLRRKERLGRSGIVAIVAFSLLGLAFMLAEIEMFQVFALVLGHPVYALTTVLGSMLVFSGLGSLQAKRLATSKDTVFIGAFVTLVVLLGGFTLVKGWLLDVLVVAAFPVRVAGTIAILAPIAFCMGLPMSTGMYLARNRPDVMLWGWAMNGAFSVLATVLAVYSAVHVGIALTVGLGVLCYVGAGVLIGMLRRSGDLPAP